MREAYSGLTPLQEVDPNSHVNFLPLTAMYMGAQVTLCLFAPEYRQRGPDIQHFFETCTRFLYWSCFGYTEMLPNWRPCNWDAALDPDVSHSKLLLLVPLVSRFPNLIPTLKLQQFDNEWRKLFYYPAPAIWRGMETEVFWGRLEKLSNGEGTLHFTFSTFMGSLLCLPHANVDVERMFSSVNLMKTNRLHTKTVWSSVIEG